jgi:hypothetical protein
VGRVSRAKPLGAELLAAYHLCASEESAEPTRTKVRGRQAERWLPYTHVDLCTLVFGVLLLYV